MEETSREPERGQHRTAVPRLLINVATTLVGVILSQILIDAGYLPVLLAVVPLLLVLWVVCHLYLWLRALPPRAPMIRLVLRTLGGITVAVVAIAVIAPDGWALTAWGSVAGRLAGAVAIPLQLRRHRRAEHR